MKPLFVPLKTQWFRAFQSGEKSVEYRAYGPRWNETTCTPGRAVTLSHGYSGERLSGSVMRFVKLMPDQAPREARAIYPGREIAAIQLTILSPAVSRPQRDLAL